MSRFGIGGKNASSLLKRHWPKGNKLILGQYRRFCYWTSIEWSDEGLINLSIELQSLKGLVVIVSDLQPQVAANFFEVKL